MAQQAAKTENNSRVWSRYDDVKIQFSEYHTGFIHAVSKLKAATLLKRPSHVLREHKLSALQNLLPLLHLGVLSGAILNPDDENVSEAEKLLEKWEDVTLQDLNQVVGYFKRWLIDSHFYDIRIDTESRQVIDIEQTLKEAGL